MREFWILSKALLKNTYSISFKKEDRKKIWLALLVVALCIPCVVFLVGFFNILFDTGLTSLALSFGFLATCAVSFFTVLFSFPNVFYFSEDLPLLLPLPVKPAALIGAKTMVVLASMIPFMLWIYIPLVIACFMTPALSLVQSVLVLVVGLLVPLPTLFLLGALTIVLMRFLPLFANKDRFAMIMNTFMLVFAVGISVFSQLLGQNMIEDPQAMIEVLTSSGNAFLQAACGLFFQIPSASEFITLGSVWQGLVFILIVIASLAVFWLVSTKMYLKAAMSAQNNSSKGKKLSQGEIKKRSAFAAMMKAEWQSLVRTPAYATNCIMGNAVGPIVMIAVFVAGSGSQLKEVVQALPIQDYIIQNPGQCLGISFIVGTVFSMFFSSINSISATAVSRAGQSGLAWMKTLPVSMEKQLYAKMSVGVLLSIVYGFIYLIPFYWLYPLPLWLIIPFVVGIVLSSILSNQIGLLLDVVHPKLIWDSETACVKNNYNLLIDMAIGIGMLLVFAIPFVLGLTNWILYSVYVLIIMIGSMALCWKLLPVLVQRSLAQRN